MMSKILPSITSDEEQNSLPFITSDEEKTGKKPSSMKEPSHKPVDFKRSLNCRRRVGVVVAYEMCS